MNRTLSFQYANAGNKMTLPSRIGVERVAFQTAAIQELRREPALAGYAIVEVAADQDKVSRVSSWSPIAEQGRIYLVDDGTGWHEKLLTECETFPLGKHDDLVDAVGIAFATLRMGEIASVRVGRLR